MSRFEFKPPMGSAYVQYSMPVDVKTEGGIYLPTSKKPPTAEGVVTSVGDETSELSVGDSVLFDLSRATRIAESIYCVNAEDDIHCIITPVGGIPATQLVQP